MRLITYIEQGACRIGALTPGERIVDLQAAHRTRTGAASPHLASMLDFLHGDERARELGQAAIEYALRTDDPLLLTAPERIRLLPPVPRPESIREFMAFEQHVINCARKRMAPWRARADLWLEKLLGRDHTLAKRACRPWYERPVYYKGNRYAVVGHGTEVEIPRYCRRFDYELEFGIFLSRQGRDIAEHEARRYIGGYVIFNDFSARDMQAREMPGRLGPSKGKDFDTGNSMGPCLVTPDEVPDPYTLAMGARINGETVSRGTSADMHFSFEEMLAYVSQNETLYPGEFFGSGTCSGAQGKGCGLEHGRYLQPGDIIELEVERLGVLRNHVVASPATLSSPAPEEHHEHI
jgi:2-keto-4-pentenoate hydratase/2-oxohepta-3-ene-1,7-dioic acid hydratase in catechol pathway